MSEARKLDLYYVTERRSCSVFGEIIRKFFLQLVVYSLYHNIMGFDLFPFVLISCHHYTLSKRYSHLINNKICVLPRLLEPPTLSCIVSLWRPFLRITCPKWNLFFMSNLLSIDLLVFLYRRARSLPAIHFKGVNMTLTFFFSGSKAYRKTEDTSFSLTLSLYECCHDFSRS